MNDVLPKFVNGVDARIHQKPADEQRGNCVRNCRIAQRQWEDSGESNAAEGSAQNQVRNPSEILQGSFKDLWGFPVPKSLNRKTEHGLNNPRIDVENSRRKSLKSQESQRSQKNPEKSQRIPKNCSKNWRTSKESDRIGTIVQVNIDVKGFLVIPEDPWGSLRILGILWLLKSRF